jgi:hypothetical protein
MRVRGAITMVRVQTTKLLISRGREERIGEGGAKS